MQWLNSHFLVVVLLSISMGSGSSSSFAQITPRPAAGVYIDAEGVLRSRDSEAGVAKKQNSTKKESLKKIVGLRQLFERAQREQSIDHRLSMKSRTFEGLLRVNQVIVDETKKEIFIAGPTEVLDISDPDNPVGKESGRPALRLEDFVVSLRAIGPGRRMRLLGCSIDLMGDVKGRLTQAAEPLIATQNYQPSVIVQAMQQAIGMQTVRFFGLEPNTRFALVCLTADVGLKRLALGLDESPVRKIKSHLSMSKEREAVYNRWWFVAQYDPIGVSKGGMVYRLSGPRLRVLASDSPTLQTEASPAARKFAEMLNENMEPLCAGLLSFADLQNVTDLAVVAALMSSDNLAEKIEWDLEASLAEFVVPTVPIAKEVEPLVNFVHHSQAIQVATGGVQLNLESVIQNRQEVVIEKVPARTLPPPPGGKTKTKVR